MAIAIKILLIIAVFYTNVCYIQADGISDVVDDIINMFGGKDDEQHTVHRNHVLPSFEQVNKCLIHLVSPNLAAILRSCDFLGALGQSSQSPHVSAGQHEQKYDQGRRQFPIPNYGFSSIPYQGPVWPPQYTGEQAGQQQIPAGTYQQPLPVQQPQPVPAAQPQPAMQPPMQLPAAPQAPAAAPQAPPAPPPRQG